MELKQFTGSGLENFKRVYLDIRAALSNGEHKDLKISELLSDKFTRTIDNEISLPSGPFKNRYDFAEKIVDSFKRTTMDEQMYNPNMWSFLACYYFKSVCMDKQGNYRKGNNRNSLGDISRVILDTSTSRRTYRHLVWGPARMYYETDSFSKKILSNRLFAAGEIYEQVASRPSVLCGSALGIFSKVGWDSQKRNWKSGFHTHLDWSVREIALTLNQLTINYSYYHCENDESQKELYNLLHENQKATV
jgi:hypothetical protein|tara:strand:- start:177 stop:920 length:744 start_codon:yes stop_codon:yes gene_type:complete